MTPILLATLAPSLVSGQAFEKGNKIIGAGIRISLLSVNDPDDDDSDDTGKDAAASYTIPISFEYAFTDKIGGGLEIGFCNYFAEEDSITGSLAEASSFDLLFRGDFHYVRGGRVDLCSGLGLGFSSFQYKSNDFEESEFNSTGFYLRLDVFQARFYVAKFLALQLNLGVPYFNFENGRITDRLGSDYSFPLTFAGVDIGTGLTFKF